MKKSFERAYLGSDGYMLETAGTLHLLFVADLAEFTAFDSTLDAAYATAWEAKILAVYNMVPDSLIKDIQAGKTATVLALMEQATEKYSEVKFFVNKVFKDNPAVRNEFGVDTYRIARKSQTAMIQILGEMHLTCEKFATELVTGGYDQTKIDEIETLRLQLYTANLAQEDYKKERRSLTQDRIDIHNACYEATRIIIDAAMVVFKDNPARRKSYVYSPSSGGGGGNDGDNSQIININVANDNIPVLVYSIPYTASRQIRINNTGPADVEAYLSNTSGVTTNIAVIAAGMNLLFSSNNLGIDGDNLYLKCIAGPATNANVELEISLEE